MNFCFFFFECFTAVVLWYKYYYPFGMTMPLRNANPGYYRYGFNGQEKDDEVSGAGNSNTAMFWQYDTRLGRRWNQDPKPNPSISNYAAFANNPIWFNDPLGDTIRVSSVIANKKDETDQKQFDEFASMMDDQFSNKVNFDTKSDGNGLYSISGLSAKEGETLSEEEKERFDYLSGLATQKEDFNVGLSNENGVPNGREFVKFDYPTYDVTFNMPLLSKIPENKAGFGKNEFVYFGMVGGNRDVFNAGSTFQVKSYEHRPNVVGMLNNYAKTTINLETGTSNIKRIVFSTALYLGNQPPQETRPMSRTEVKVKTR